jgi:acyl-CoA hydrolase
VAELLGRTVRERVDAPIAIADPRFRPELTQAVADVRSLFRSRGEPS